MEWSTGTGYSVIARYQVGSFASRWQPGRFYLHPRFCPPKGLGRGSLCQQSTPRRQNMPDKFSKIYEPNKFSNRSSFSRSIRIMDAKSANQKKEDNRISHEWGRGGQPGHSFGKGRIFLWVTGNPPPTNPKIHSYMIKKYPQARQSTQKVDYRYAVEIFHPF